MMQHNWLLHYREIEGLNHALNGMARRTVFRSNLEHAAGELQDNYGLYQERFNLFFPDLKQYAADYVQNMILNGGRQNT
jgi:acyl carrier protein phosphodiesterase